MPRTREQNYQVVRPPAVSFNQGWQSTGGGLSLSKWRAGTSARYVRHPWTGIAWSPELGLFAACASDGYVSVSTDGESWTDVYFSFAKTWTGITWCPVNSIFCVISDGADPQVLVSSGDPPTWSTVTMPNRIWSSVAVGTLTGGQEVLCAAARDSSRAIALSLDGSNWTEHFGATGETADYMRAICWNNTLKVFQAVSDSNISKIFGSRITPGLSGATFYPTIVDMPSNPGVAGSTGPLENSTWSGVAYSPLLDAYMAVATYSSLGDVYVAFGKDYGLDFHYWVEWPATMAGSSSIIFPRNAITYIPEIAAFYAMGSDVLDTSISRLGIVAGSAATTDGTKFGEVFTTNANVSILEYVLIRLTITTPGSYAMYMEIWETSGGLPSVLIATSDNTCTVDTTGRYRFYFNKISLAGSTTYAFSINGKTGVSCRIDTFTGNRVTYNGSTWTDQADDVADWKIIMNKVVESGVSGYGTLRTYGWKANNVRQGIGDDWKAIAYAPEISRFCAVGALGWTMIQDVTSDMESASKNLDDLIQELEFQDFYHDRIRAMHAIVGRIGQLGTALYPGSSDNLVTLNGTKVITFNFGQDDFGIYNTGTWSPVSTVSTVDGVAPITVNWAKYTVIENVCFIDVSIKWETQTAAQQAQIVALGGLPYDRMAGVRSFLKVDRNKDTDQLSFWLNQSPMIYADSPSRLHMRDPLDYAFGSLANGLSGQTTRISGFYFISGSV